VFSKASADNIGHLNCLLTLPAEQVLAAAKQ
jgi:hypothetical protein